MDINRNRLLIADCVEKLFFAPPEKFHDLKVRPQIALDCRMWLGILTYKRVCQYQSYPLISKNQ
jgi:hypothetical protein